MAREMMVKVAKLGDKVQEFYLEGGKVVSDVLSAAGIAAGADVRLNGEPAKPTDQLRDGDIVVAVPNVRGGR